MPHSFSLPCSHHQRPARRSSLAATGRVHGSHPMLRYDCAYSGCTGTPRSSTYARTCTSGPSRNGVDLDDASVPVVELDGRGGRPPRRLLPSKARHPAVHVGESSLQRRHLADVAAVQAQLRRSIEGIDAVVACERVELPGVRADHLDVPVPMGPELGQVPVGRLGEPACVDGQQPHRRIELERHAGHRNPLHLEAGDDDPPFRREARQGPRHEVARTGLEPPPHVCQLATRDRLVPDHEPAVTIHASRGARRKLASSARNSARVR